MSTNSEANKRIAKNTMLLYIRMGVMMIISFFTARITLEALGVVDYGINNVVGGLVSMFSLISSSLSSSVSRFITFGLGKGDKKELNTIFSTSVNIHVILAIIVVIAIETIGIWFLNNKMVIPAERLTAAHWVLQCSTFMFALGLLSTPYNAAIIAHERMDVYANFTLFDAFSRLAIVFSIKYYGGDKLILLAIISLIPSLIKQFYYWYFSKKNFEECTYHAVWDKKVFKEMFGFAGWNFIGASSAQMKDQGVNIVINMFTGPAVNAARGIAMQINSIVGQFASNFTAAIKPQITKEFAAKNFIRMHKLIFNGTRFTYFLFLIISVPVFFEIKTILHLWLGVVPAHSVSFTRLIILLSMVEVISNTLITAQFATGKIRNYQIVVGGTQLLNLPISYILLKQGHYPETTIIVAIIISQICFLERLLFLRKSVNLPSYRYFKEVYLRLMLVTILSAIVPAIIHSIIKNPTLRFFTTCSTSVVATFVVIYTIGLGREERYIAYKYVKRILNRLRR